MKLVRTNCQLETDPYLTKSVGLNRLREVVFKDFDKDGYEVPNLVEQETYLLNGVDLNNIIQYHVAPVKAWYLDEEDSEEGLVLDHCMLLCRKAFAGQALEDIKTIAKERPFFNKFLQIQPRWGLDFSLDYVTHEHCLEVIHIEQDFYNYKAAEESRIHLEAFIENTDWEAGVRELISRKSEWGNLSADDHSDYKAQFFGLDRAFDNRKIF